MRCSYCLEEALYKCGCQQSYICATHLGKHLATFGEHEYGMLNIDLEEPRLQDLRSNILKKIQNINEAEKSIVLKTRSLIKAIEEELKGAIERLNRLKEECFEILMQKKYCKSDIPKIEKIKTIEFDLKFVEIDKILGKIENTFGVEFTYYMEKRIVREK